MRAECAGRGHVEPAVATGLLSRIDQNAGDQETGEDEEKIDARASQRGGVDHEPLSGGVIEAHGRRIVEPVGEENTENRQSPNGIEFRHNFPQEGLVMGYRGRQDFAS